MRISDWSSDVCSSDLKEAKPNGLLPERGPRCIAPAAMMQSRSRKQAWKGKPIVLVGLMGVGKSTVGKRLATRLRLPFVDADTEIETAAGMSISDIFERFGEPYFRDGERRVIARLVDGPPQIGRGSCRERV